ncbi:hypothetical protein FGG08_006223 [Glutinoglossum americanum]|uniref:Uncharacterized protein n=1 Tax=Glutinoglossum americanum TaxID=1670608 RepID=A0A9P8KXQ4_9PEZI|nr:hypothetical protein FGG08_006223 [Glutinoglossum americanum]
MLSRITLPTQRVLSRHSNLSIRSNNLILRQSTLARFYVAKSEADIKIEGLQEHKHIYPYLYGHSSLTGIAKFEIAAEETSKKSIYASEDRKTAREELARLKELYATATGNSGASVAAEIKERVGQRVRELEGAVEELNKVDLED